MNKEWTSIFFLEILSEIYFMSEEEMEQFHERMETT
jgi:hypothetical protein